MFAIDYVLALALLSAPVEIPERLFDLAPVARSTVVDELKDGVIVLDAQDRVIDLNPAAAWIIGRPAERSKAEQKVIDFRSPVGRLERELLGKFAFPAVAVLEQLLLVVEELLAGFGGELEIRPFDDRIDRASLLAVAAIDAFRHIDVIARCAAAAVLPRLGLDRDRQRRADRLA